MLGAILAEHALDGLYKPEVTDDVRVTPDGRYVDAQGNPTTLYKDPSTLMRMISPTAQQYSDLNARYKASPLLAQQEESNRMYTPTYANQQHEAMAYGNTDAPKITGTLGGQADITNAGTVLGQAKFNDSQQPTIHNTAAALNTDALTRARSINPNRTIADITAAQSAAQNAPTDAQTAALKSQYDNTAAMFGVSDQGLNQHAQHLNSVASEYNAGLIGQRGANTMFGANVGDNGVSEIPGVNPTYANMMRVMNAKGGSGGPAVASGPAGGFMPAKPQLISSGSYLPGSSHQDNSVGSNSSKVSADYLANARDYTPVSANPDLLINPKTNSVVDKNTGQDVTQQALSIPAVKHMIAQELNDREQSRKDLTHRAKVSALKAQMDLLNSQKVNDGLVGAQYSVGTPDDQYPKNPLVGIPAALGQGEAALESAQLPQHFVNGLHKLQGYGDQAYQSLFGE